jgi:signal transduction histidine kinase
VRPACGLSRPRADLDPYEEECRLSSIASAPARGVGLIELGDRVEALGGKLTLESPPGRGTTISIELPGAGR